MNLLKRRGRFLWVGAVVLVAVGTVALGAWVGAQRSREGRGAPREVLMPVDLSTEIWRHACRVMVLRTVRQRWVGAGLSAEPSKKGLEWLGRVDQWMALERERHVRALDRQMHSGEPTPAGVELKDEESLCGAAPGVGGMVLPEDLESMVAPKVPEELPELQNWTKLWVGRWSPGWFAGTVPGHGTPGHRTATGGSSRVD